MSRDISYCGSAKDCPLKGKCKRAHPPKTDYPLTWFNPDHNTPSQYRTCEYFIRKY